MGQPLPPKKDVVLSLLERATVFIHVDPRRQGCVVPMNFKQQAQLVLQVGLNMAVPIPDLRIEDTGITCTLSFGGRGFWCSMPWSCVYAMVGEDGRGMVWPDDLPPEVRATAKPEADQSAPTEEPRAPKRKRAPKQKIAAEAKPEKKVAKKRAAPKKKAAPNPEPVAAPADIRQRLVAVKKQEAPVVPDETVQRQAPETPPPVGQRKPKRELPPYLRVVK